MTLRATPGTRQARATTRPVSDDSECSAHASATLVDDASTTLVDCDWTTVGDTVATAEVAA